MAIPVFNINDAYLYSPKSDTTADDLNPEKDKKVFAQNVNQTQNELGYFWSSSGVPLELETQNKTACAVADYVFENILEDRSSAQQHSDSSDLYIADRINFQQNTKHLGNTNHKGVMFFMPSYTNTSNSVNLQIYGQNVVKVYKRGFNGDLIDLDKGDIVADRVCLMVFDYRESTPCFVLGGIFTKDSIQSAAGKYTVGYISDMVNTPNNIAYIGQTILNVATGTLSKDKIGEDGTTVTGNSICTVYKIDNNGVIHYREALLKPGDIIFATNVGKFYYFNGAYLSEIGADGRYVFHAYSDDGTTIIVNTDQTDLAYVTNLSGARNIFLAGTPSHMHKTQLFLNIIAVGAINFINTASWLDGVLPVFNTPGVYVFCFTYDAVLQKWIGSVQGVYN